jgi:multidrug efflux pump subunit AcrB
VAKNGILMLDLVDHFIELEFDLREALIRSGRRRLRPVLMTSMAAALGMLPLAYGIGSGADNGCRLLHQWWWLPSEARV